MRRLVERYKLSVGVRLAPLISGLRCVAMRGAVCCTVPRYPFLLLTCFVYPRRWCTLCTGLVLHYLCLLKMFSGLTLTIDLMQGCVASRLATAIYVAMVTPIFSDNSYSPNDSNLKYESYRPYSWFFKNSQTLTVKYWVLWWVAKSCHSP